jgi:hypothetical protein
MKGDGWASAGLLGRDTEKEKKNGLGRSWWVAWGKKGGRPDGLTQEKLDFGPLPNRTRKILFFLNIFIICTLI